MIPPFNESTAQRYHERFMSTLTAKSIWKLGLLAAEKVCKKDNPEFRCLIINKFGDTNMGYKHRVCPFEDRNHTIIKISYIGNEVKPHISIDKSRLDTIKMIV